LFINEVPLDQAINEANRTSVSQPQDPAKLIGSLISCVILQITTIVLLYIVLAVEQQVAGFGTLIDAFWRTSAQANIPSAITRPPQFSNHCAFQPLRV
jgi:hypothetical protein